MNILFAAAECAPFFKTGGLGDVIGALPKELAKKGIELSVVLPYFTKMPQQYKSQCQDVGDFELLIGLKKQICGIKRLKRTDVTYYFIENAFYFDRDNLYGYEDDGERFAFFSIAIIEMLDKIGLAPDILHLNDFHTAMIPFLLKEKYHERSTIKTILTIHNIEFQGIYNQKLLLEYFGIDAALYKEQPELFEENLNYLKTGILYSDQLTTVSPTYAKEIQTPAFSFGLDPFLRSEGKKLTGILNGIDYERNNPETDQAISAHFSIKNPNGKKKNKAALQKKMNLPIRDDIPIIGMVSRLTVQKGFSLVLEELPKLLENHDVQYVLLGTGDQTIENSFRKLAEKYPAHFAASLVFDIDLAQLIYAGSDVFLMPSKTEPCGLAQMLAMRYGTLPIVHEVGGLKDTVEQINTQTNTGTGFLFTHFKPEELEKSIQLAICLYKEDKNSWRYLMENAMKKDFSWEQSSRRYLELYEMVSPS